MASTNQFQFFVKKIVLLLVLLLCNPIFSQAPAIELSPGGLLDNVYDRFGNRYNLSEIYIPSTNNTNTLNRTVQISCSNSIFSLYFEDGSGMEHTNIPSENAKRAVLCKVYEDISKFISTPEIILSGTKVNIWVRNITNISNSGASVLGVASGFYSAPESNVNGGIIDNQIWRTIQRGEDAYTNVLAPIASNGGPGAGLFYHGQVAFNPNVNWHTNLSTAAAPGEFDLYSIALHEILHSLGFNSLIDENGGFKLGPLSRYYSRYDTFLKDNTGSDFLISPADTQCSMYNYTFNLSPTILRPNCNLPDNLNNGNSLDATLCSDAIKYVSPQFPSHLVPIYTPICYETGSSLSHFEDELFPDCINPEGNNTYFVMSNANFPGTTKRHITVEERQTLCDMGYNVKGSYGTSPSPVLGGYFNFGGISCNENTVAGLNDGFDGNNNYQFFGGVSPLQIQMSGGDLLGNDLNADSFECLEDMLDSSSTLNGLSSISGTSSDIINFSTPNPGIHLLRYVPVNSDGRKGNITYVYVYVSELVEPGFDGCDVNVCNMVVNGGFEQYNSEPTLNLAEIWKACGWGAAFGSVDYFHTLPFTVPCNILGQQTVNNGQGDAYAGVIVSDVGSEIMTTRLASPLLAGVNYQLSFDVSLGESSSSFARSIQAYLSPTAVNIAPNNFPITNNNMLFVTPAVSNSNGWSTYTFEFTASGGEEFLYLGGIQNMIVEPHTPVHPPIGNCNYADYNTPLFQSFHMTYIFVDNVSIVPLDNAAFNLPSTICSELDISNLTSYLSGVTLNGNFSGEGVINNAGIFTFNPLIAGIGEHTITYTYQNNLNCNISISKAIAVTQCITTTFDPIGPLCVGSTPPALPTVSTNTPGITGLWDGPIDTSTAGVFTFHFTPDPGQNASEVTMTVTVITTTPTFDPIGPICQGENFTLPTTSLEQIPGTWSASPDNMHTTTYEFAPDDPSACVVTGHITVEVVDPNLPISFNPELFQTLCYGDEPPVLPTVDNNGVEGTWNYPTVDNTMTRNYIFTPLADCLNPVTYTIGVIQGCSFSLFWGSEVSCQNADHVKLYGVDIADGPCLRVAENSLVSYELHGNTSSIVSTEWIVTGGTTSNETNTSCDVLWSDATYCALQGVIHLSNGGSITINRCIEKLEAPHAAIGINSHPVGQPYNSCIKAAINFENYSFANGGDDNLYYNWYFGDGTTSNEFEPTHVYESSGEFTVTLIVYNGCSCVDQATMTVNITEGGLKINCEGVACQGGTSHYTTDPNYCTDFSWQVTGGTILSQQNNNSSIDVLWDSVDNDGFGYVSLSAPSCDSCTTQLKIPVVKQLGNIKGDLTVCPKSQNLYSLPQWPTTDFNWTVNDNGTGAFLILTTQRNQIILNSILPGTVDLYCSYRNTLLNCGGTAHFVVQVSANAIPSGLTSICQGQSATYEIRDSSGTLISGATWVVNGPGSFEQTGMENPFSVNFQDYGVYTITTEDIGHCVVLPLRVTVLEKPSTPKAIIGPSVTCPGTSVTFSCVPPEGSVAHWSVNNGTISGSATGSSISVNFNATALTPFVVSVWYEIEGCISTTFSRTIGRDVPDLAVIHKDVVVCGSSYGDYSINSTTADSFTWSITPATAGSIQSGQNSTAIHVLWNQQAQFATVKLQIVKCGQTYEIAPITVQVINAPQITISGPTAICSGQNVQFNFAQNPSGAFTSVNWNFGDGASNTTGLHSFQTPLNGSVNYVVSATVTGANGCLMDALGTLNVQVSPSPIIALTPNRDANICDFGAPAESYTYSVTMQGGFAATDIIRWYHNGVLVSSASGVGPSFATINAIQHPTGTYYATVENSFGCVATTNSFHTIIDCSEECNAEEDVDFSYNVGCQTINAYTTSLPAGYTSVDWWHGLIPGAFITTTPTTFSASNVPPGEYPIRLEAFYPHNGENCLTFKEINIIVPYQADLKYEVTCGSNNNYTVTLFDFSTYYAGTPPTAYLFKIDNGNWIPGTLVQGIWQYSATLAPGNHSFGIKILIPGSLYPSCEKIIPLNLPGFSNVEFTPLTGARFCKDSPIQFTVTNPNPNYHYSWDFGDDSFNLQQDPVKTFSTSGPKSITLNITNQYGCPVSSALHTITVLNVNMVGDLQVSPSSTCQGGQINLHYNSTAGPLPDQYLWYQNTVTSTPYAVTTNASLPSPDLTITQNGYYIVYIKDSNGCQVNNIQGVTASFTPLPPAVPIKGNATVCLGSPVKLNIQGASDVIYEWTCNGVVQPQWNNQHEIEDMQTTDGVYTYTVTPRVLSSGTTYCYGSPSTYEVTVLPLPDLPILSQSMVSCVPYEVAVTITHPQSDAGYYWSNGGTGSSTVMIHDGPLQVRAVINECSVKTQIDMPTDLESVSWVFPKGCFGGCDKPAGTILGPLGNFDTWQWLADNTVIQQGGGTMPSLSDLQVDTSYSMNLDSGPCELQTGSMNYHQALCTKCVFSIAVEEVNCVRFNNQNMYQVQLSINNPGAAVAGMFTAPNGEGYFTPGAITIPSGNTVQTLVFAGQSGFMGGAVSVTLTSWVGDEPCEQKFAVTLPEDCQTIDACQFEYKVSNVNCVKTDYGPIYHIGVEVTNPYPVNAVAVVSIPSSLGTVSPVTVVSTPGISYHDFYFYPLPGFSGGYFPLTLTNTIGATSCPKLLEMHLPEICSQPKECNISYELMDVQCQLMPDGHYAFAITMHLTSSSTVTGTVTFSSPNGQGHFLSPTITVPPGNSTYILYFYPENGYMGGAVELMTEGHYLSRICIGYHNYWLPPYCCDTCKTADFNDILLTAENALIIAPNPAAAATTIFYNFVNNSSDKEMVLTDALGRKLQVWHPKDDKGTLQIDCTRYAQGHYLVIMKSNGSVLKVAKFIKD